MAGTPKTSVKFARLFRESRLPIYAIGAGRQWLFCNPACEALTGVAAERLIGVECRRLGPTAPAEPPSVAGSLCPPDEAFTGRPTRTQALLIGANGERLWKTVHCLPLGVGGRESPGEPRVLLCWLTDPVPGEDQPKSPPEELAVLRERIYRRFGFDHMVARSPVMQRLLHQVRCAAASRMPVFLSGEPSTGKETLAQTIHYQGAARDQPFMAIDCVALPENLISKQLADLGFFTDREESRRITLYLREPQHLPRELQAAILRVVGDRPLAESARMMAGMSDGDPRHAVHRGLLMAEFYDYLSPMVISVPSLRERRDDIPLLVQQLVESFQRTPGSDGADRGGIVFHAEAISLLCEYRWPGNFAEFNAVIRELSATATGQPIAPEQLPHRIRASVELDRIPPPRPEKPLPLDALLETAERRLLELALDDAKGNRSKAAARLGISRARLHRRIIQLGITGAEPPAGDAEIELAEE